jgi:restriction system protein
MERRKSDHKDPQRLKSYYRVMLGKKSAFAEQCFVGSFIGADFDIAEDLSGKLSDEFRSFSKQFIPVFLAAHPDKTKIGAGLACGALWMIAKGIGKGEIVLCPDGAGTYRVGEVIGGYQYARGQVLPHRRPVQWMGESIDRAAMSDGLRNSAGSAGTVSDISRHREEIEKLIRGVPPDTIVSTDPTVEDPSAFAMEKHLEDFLVRNWAHTELGKEYDIFEEEGEKVGQQYPTDTGPIDVLAIRKDKKELLVLELKKGRASDAVVGQVLRYMGYAAQELAEDGQTVKGVIIALEDDQRLRRALAATSNIVFYRYQVNFKLLKA